MSKLIWRGLLSAVSLAWWHVATIRIVSGDWWHPDWTSYVTDVINIVDAIPTRGAAVLLLAFVAAAWPWVLGGWAPTGRNAPVPGGSGRTYWRTAWSWERVVIAAVLVATVPQPWLVREHLRLPPVAAGGAEGVGAPDRPLLWVIVESGDAGAHMPRLWGRPNTYYEVDYRLGAVYGGSIAGVWAQICGEQLLMAPHPCLVTDQWRIVYGQSGWNYFSSRLATTGAAVFAGEDFSAAIPRGDWGVPDWAVLAQALEPHLSRPHVLALTGDTHETAAGAATGETWAATDRLVDDAVATWLARGGVALVTADHPRRPGGLDVIPARLYGLDAVRPPTYRHHGVAQVYLPGTPSSVFDLGCTAWWLAGWGCDRLGHGVSLAAQASETAAPFRSTRREGGGIAAAEERDRSGRI